MDTEFDIEIPAVPLADPKLKVEEPKEKPDKDVYSGIDELPTGRAGDMLYDGIILLEGGAWRGLYTLGVLDAMMKNDVNIRDAAGISAGALSSLGYISGQIGWSARIDLKYRHDRRYVGIGAMKKDHGVTGFSFLFDEVLKEMPIDLKRLNDPSRRLVVGVTNMTNGQTEFMEKGKCNLAAAVRASATVPYVSRPVVIDGVPYLDGGCSTKIPYHWALEEGYKKIVVVKTRDWEYRNTSTGSFLNRMYSKYPEFVESIVRSDNEYNDLTDELKKAHEEGNAYVIAPSEPITISNFEGDMEKLGGLYWLGYHDGEAHLEGLRTYLTRDC